MNISSKDTVYDHELNIEVLNCITETSVNILDIGCGNGVHANYLNRQGKVVDGITISNKEAELAKINYRKIFIYNLESGLPKELSDNEYDIILCSHVIEHIAYPEKLLADIRNLLNKNDSELIVALPNFMTYKNRIRIFLGNFDYQQNGIMDYTHLRWYTYKSAIKMFNDNGFVILNAFAGKTLPWKTVLKYLPKQIKNLISELLVKISKGLFGSQFIFILKAKI